LMRHDLLPRSFASSRASTTSSVPTAGSVCGASNRPALGLYGKCSAPTGESATLAQRRRALARTRECCSSRIPELHAPARLVPARGRLRRRARALGSPRQSSDLTPAGIGAASAAIGLRRMGAGARLRT
jgi:hypothetical protein